MSRCLARMMAAAALCVAAMPLASCTPAVIETGASTAPVDQLAPIERAERAWARIRGVAVIAAAALPAPWSTDLTAWIERGDRALEMARGASDAVEQLKALRDVEAAVAAIAPTTALLP